MEFVLKTFILVIALIAGVAFMRYNYQLTQIFGYNSYAEKYLGDGGTYTMWKLLGLFVIVLAIIYAF